MRLINTETLNLEDFKGKIPKYAILSHVWGDDEVTLQEYDPHSQQRASYGWEKIMQCCRIAKDEEIQYAWIDTCCIDKTNNVELSEAINSMFTWYENAKVCYTFLHDLSMQNDASSTSTASKLKDCKWFTRGWTLQELIASRKLVFFDQDFRQLGTRQRFAETISTFTGIPQRYLLYNHGFRETCVGQRMSWVSQRDTIREEDIAYCLLGIFDVNMPLIYGEGQKKAFVRLQEHIIAQSDDETIFAWQTIPKFADPEVANPKGAKTRIASKLRGILAEDPTEFWNGGRLRRSSELDRPPHAFSNRGLAFPVPTHIDPRRFASVHVELDCWYIESRLEVKSEEFENLDQMVSSAEYHGYVTARTEELCKRRASVKLRQTPLGEKHIWCRANAEELIRTPYWNFRRILSHLGTGYTTIYIARSTSSLEPRDTLMDVDANSDLLQHFFISTMYLLYMYMFAGGFALTLCTLALSGEEWSAPLLLMSWAYLALGWMYFQWKYWFPFSIILLGNVALSWGPGVHSRARWLVLIITMVVRFFNLMIRAHVAPV